MTKFTALVVPADPEQPAYWHDFGDYTEIQAKVGGSFDVFTAQFDEHTVSVYVDGEGLYKYTTINPLATVLRGYTIVGDAVIAGAVDVEGEQLSLPTIIGEHFIGFREAVA